MFNLKSLVSVLALILMFSFVFSLTLFVSPQSSFAVLECIVDPDGVDDISGNENQRDLNEVCLSDDPENDDAFTQMCDGDDDLLYTWNWDNTNWSGANTGDVCSLYDTDGDGNANVAYCVTVNGSPATLVDQELCSCTDGAPDRCTGPSCSDSSDFCGVTELSNDDPFPGTGEDQSGFDTKGDCCIDVDTIAPGGELTTICAYPSSSRNSAPTECIALPSGCETNEECSDGLVCTEDICTIEDMVGTCSNPTIPDCCDEDADCEPGGALDDGDVCTDGTCNESNECEFTEDESNAPECAPTPTPTPTPTPEPVGGTLVIPTMGQWGMIITAIVLGFFAVRMLRHRKDSEI